MCKLLTHWQDKTDRHALRLWLLIKNAICKPFYSQPKWKQLKYLEVAFFSSSEQEAHLGFLSNPICHTSGERGRPEQAQPWKTSVAGVCTSQRK